MEFVDGKYAGNLLVELDWALRMLRITITFSRSCLTSSWSTPLGALCSRIIPDCLTTLELAIQTYLDTFRHRDLLNGIDENRIMNAIAMLTAGSA